MRFGVFPVTWQSAPVTAHVPLPSDQVHLWCIPLDQSAERVEQLHQLLSGEERERADRFRYKRDRQRFISGRGLLRLLLHRYLGDEPDRFRFSYGPHGKPALIAPDRSLQFNLAHSQGLGLYALTHERDLGVDVEWVRHIAEIGKVAEYSFSAEEQHALSTLSAGDRLTLFFRYWTRKEAFLKAGGLGLTQSLNENIVWYPMFRSRQMSMSWARQGTKLWTLTELTLGNGCVAALAVAGDGWQPVCWRWAGQ